MTLRERLAALALGDGSIEDITPEEAPALVALTAAIQAGLAARMATGAGSPATSTEGGDAMNTDWWAEIVTRDRSRSYYKHFESREACSAWVRDARVFCGQIAAVVIRHRSEPIGRHRRRFTGWGDLAAWQRSAGGHVARSLEGTPQPKRGS